MELQMNDSTIKPAFNAKAGRLRQVSLPASEDRLANAQSMGWNDVVRGEGFRDAYDGWKRKRQWAYERGRTQATLAKVAGGTLTLWKRDENLWGPLNRALPMAKARRVVEEAQQGTRKLLRKRKTS